MGTFYSQKGMLLEKTSMVLRFWSMCDIYSCGLYSYPESLSDCQSDLCFTTAVVAGSVSTASLLCIISCLIGALLHHILISSPCWKSSKPRKKKQKTTQEPQPLYDEITLAECDGKAQTDPSVLNKEKIVTTQNMAYVGVQLPKKPNNVG